MATPLIPAGVGGQHSMSSRLAWSSRASSKKGSKVTEKPCVWGTRKDEEFLQEQESVKKEYL